MVIVEITLLSIPEVRSYMVGEISGLDVDNLSHWWLELGRRPAWEPFAFLASSDVILRKQVS